MKNFQLVHQGFTVTAEERVTLRIKNTLPTARMVVLKRLHRLSCHMQVIFELSLHPEEIVSSMEISIF